MTLFNSSLKVSTNASTPTSNSRQYHPSPLASSSSDPPSSPSSSYFYSTPKNPLRSSTKQRSYQSTTSSRSVELNTSLRAQTLSNARKARQPSSSTTSRANRGYVDPFEIGPSGFESGSKNSEGQFELYTEEEERYLGYQTFLEGRRRRDLLEERAELEGEDWLKAEDEVEREEEIMRGESNIFEQEPPSDVYDEDSGESQQSIPSLPPENHFFLPSLASEPTESSQTMDVDEFVGEGQGESQEESQVSNSSNHSYSSFDNPNFAQVLLASNCPACNLPRTIQLQGGGNGVICRSCGWNISPGLLAGLESVFVSHAPNDHLPLFGWTQFTGTIVLCSKCDAEYAV